MFFSLNWLIRGVYYSVCPPARRGGGGEKNGQKKEKKKKHEMPKGKKALAGGRSPLRELEVYPHNRLYILVFLEIKNKKIIAVNQQLWKPHINLLFGDMGIFAFVFVYI